MGGFAGGIHSFSGHDLAGPGSAQGHAGDGSPSSSPWAGPLAVRFVGAESEKGALGLAEGCGIVILLRSKPGIPGPCKRWHASDQGFVTGPRALPRMCHA